MPDFVNIDISLDSKPISHVKIPISHSQPREHANRLVGKPLREWVKTAITTTLIQHAGSIRKSARALEMSESTFFRKIKELDINPTAIKEQVRLSKKLSKAGAKL